MTLKKSNSGHAACVLECGGCDAAFHCAVATHFLRVIKIYLRLFKAIQSYLRVLLKKKIV